MTVHPGKLAAALVAVLAPVVPPELDLSVEGSFIRLGVTGTPWWSGADLAASVTDDTDATVEWVLDSFQTDIAEVTTEPWPAAAPGPMPDAFAEIRQGELVCGYGNPAAPVLQLPAIRLVDIKPP